MQQISHSLAETFQERKKKKWDRLMKEHKKAQKEQKRGKQGRIHDPKSLLEGQNAKA